MPADRWADDSEDSSDDKAARRERKRAKKAAKAAAAAEAAAAAAAAPPAAAAAAAPAAAAAYDPLVSGCRNVDAYERLSKIDEGSYGVVFRARERSTGVTYALKQVKFSREAGREGFPVTALRETNVLLALSHPNIVGVREMVTGSSMDKVYMVMELFQHDLKDVLEKLENPFSAAECKRLMLQLVGAVEHMHGRWFLHRDLKTSNLLYSDRGKLAIADFGLARKYGDPVRPYTATVVTLWYRCPELLCGASAYSTPLDMWSVGCIFGELLTRKPLLPGNGEIDQLDKIFRLLGAPTTAKWPGYAALPASKTFTWRAQPHSKLRDRFPRIAVAAGTASLGDAGFALLDGLLAMDPTRRTTAADALAHAYFSEAPAPTPEHLMPTLAAAWDEGT